MADSTIATIDDWLNGPGDLQTAIVEDVPVKGKHIKVQGLAAAYSNRASSEALEMKQVGRDQVASVNTERLEIIQFAQGVVEPKTDEAQAKVIAEKYGPAFKKVVAKIDELSGVDKEAIENAEARFPARGGSKNGEMVEDAAPARSS